MIDCIHISLEFEEFIIHKLSVPLWEFMLNLKTYENRLFEGAIATKRASSTGRNTHCESSSQLRMGLNQTLSRIRSSTIILLWMDTGNVISCLEK
jgi:hypothetical protein